MASPFVRVPVALTPIPLVVRMHSLQLAVAIVAAVDSVHCSLANDHAVTMDYSIRFVAASVSPVT